MHLAPQAGCQSPSRARCDRTGVEGLVTAPADTGKPAPRVKRCGTCYDASFVPVVSFHVIDQTREHEGGVVDYVDLADLVRG
jgi:hypothetical protein